MRHGSLHVEIAVVLIVARIVLNELRTTLSEFGPVHMCRRRNRQATGLFYSVLGKLILSGRYMVNWVSDSHRKGRGSLWCLKTRSARLEKFSFLPKAFFSWPDF